MVSTHYHLIWAFQIALNWNLSKIKKIKIIKVKKKLVFIELGYKNVKKEDKTVVWKEKNMNMKFWAFSHADSQQDELFQFWAWSVNYLYYIIKIWKFLPPDCSLVSRQASIINWNCPLQILTTYDSFLK